MGSAPATKMAEPIIMEEQQTKRAGLSTKRAGVTTKRFAEMTEQYSDFGAEGDYTVTLTTEKEYTIKSAISIRVLDHGELNLVTDSGRWFLFAANSWTTVFPTQPKPGESGVA
jgi:hypothetical protein